MSRTKRLLAVLLALCGALLCGCGQRETETEELPVLVQCLTDIQDALRTEVYAGNGQPAS